jgi:hypothetical protein
LIDVDIVLVFRLIFLTYSNVTVNS